MTYTLFEFHTRNEIDRAWLISILTDYGFEGFEETTASLKGYIDTEKMSVEKMNEILLQNEFSHIKTSNQIIQNKNWNEEWEKNFEPVNIQQQVLIRAPFHAAATGVAHEIIIEPKMSFGTGHHATTSLVVQQMLTLNFKNKTVLDFGSGTGVLAILAEKLGAQQIEAVDNEEWAYYNCLENVERNQCKKIKTTLADDTLVFHQTFDIILANINRNVILKNIWYWKNLLNNLGVLIVSGILDNDEKVIIAEAAEHGLHVHAIRRNDGWIAIHFNN